MHAFYQKAALPRALPALFLGNSRSFCLFFYVHLTFQCTLCTHHSTSSLQNYTKIFRVFLKAPPKIPHISFRPCAYLNLRKNSDILSTAKQIHANFPSFGAPFSFGEPVCMDCFSPNGVHVNTNLVFFLYCP